MVGYSSKFKYPTNDLIYNNNNSNMLFTGASIDVYEWTESIHPPINGTNCPIIQW